MPSKYCSSCGTALMPTLKLCPNCGGRTFSDQPVAVSPPPSIPAAASPPTSSTTRTAASAPSGLASAGKWVPAPHGPRIAAFLVDSLVVGVASGILYGIAKVAGLIGGTSSGSGLIGGLAILLSVAIPYAYYTLLHSSVRQSSWGKSLLGLTIMTIKGERLTRMEAFIRILLQSVVPVTGLIVLALSVSGIASGGDEAMASAAVIAVLIGFLAIAFGPYVMVFFNPQHQSLYDSICKTCVVRRSHP